MENFPEAARQVIDFANTMGCPAERPSALVVEGLSPRISVADARAESLAISNNVQLAGRKPSLARLDHGRHRQSRSRRRMHRRHHPPLPQPARRPSGDRVIIVGYPQSARIATIAKRPFAETYASETAEPDAPQVDSLASGMRALLEATMRKRRRPSGIAPRRLIQSPRRNPLRRWRSRNHLQRRPISPRCAGRDGGRGLSIHLWCLPRLLLQTESVPPVTAV